MPPVHSPAQPPAVEPPLDRAPFGAPAADDEATPSRRRHLQAVPDVPLDFEAVVRSLTPRLQSYATRRLGDRHEAEELVQEALLRAYQHRGTLRTEDDVAAWTTCVTGRLVIDRLRVRGRSTPFADVPEGPRAERDTADVVVARDQARMALDALDAMPARQAAVLWAREVEGLGYDEIGRRFSMTEPAVRSLLTRARKALRKEYAVRGGTLPGTGLALLAPWVAGTGWLDRLRSGLLKAAAPAALGVAAVGLVTGALVLPADPAAGDPARPAVTTTATPVADSLGAGLARPADAAAPAAPDAVPASTGGSAAPVAPNATTRILTGTGITNQCVDAAGAGAGGTGCAPREPGATVSVDLPDAAPAVLAENVPHLQTDLVSCQQLPTVPHTTCTPPREDS